MFHLNAHEYGIMLLFFRVRDPKLVSGLIYAEDLERNNRNID